MFVVLLIRRRGTFIIDQKRYQKTILERHQGQTYRGYVALSVSVKYVQTDASLCPEFKKHDFTEAFMVYFCRKMWFRSWWIDVSYLYYKHDKIDSTINIKV